MNAWNIINGMSLYYHTYRKNNEIQLLDPVSTVFKLCLLKFKKHGTKISIKNHTISYHEPSLFQGIQRWFSGDERNDLYKLYGPLRMFIQWYGEFEHLDFLVSTLKEGLEKLQITYKNHHILIHTLEHYKTITFESNPKEIYKKFQPLWKKEEIIMITDMITKIDDENQESLIKAIECILDGKNEEIRSTVDQMI